MIFICMDKDLKKLIDETISETFAEAPEKLVERGIREIQYDICPHCKTEIHEKHEYTEDGGITWRHSDCKGLIARPETPLEEVASWLRPYVKEAQNQRQAARKALGMIANESINVDGMPISGHEKYDRQQPEGPMAAVNTSGLEESGRSEKDEKQPIAPHNYAKFMDGSVRVVNVTNMPISVGISEIAIDAGHGIVAKSYIVHIEDAGPSK